MTGLSELPPLREVIAAHRLSARRQLGQNFLLDGNITDKIAALAGPLEGRDVLEIGPGPGGLTRSLVKAGARRVVAVEKDARFLPALRDLAASAANTVIIHGDALEFDAQAHLARPAKVVSNLPFNAAAKLFSGWMEAREWPPFWESLTLMFQQETAERIIARPGSKTYGRLSVLAQWRSRARLVLKVPAAAFVPRPKVNASVITIDCPRSPPDAPDMLILGELTKAAFGQRRKMLRTSLRHFCPDINACLEETGIDPSARPETVSIDQFRCLARSIPR